MAISTCPNIMLNLKGAFQEKYCQVFILCAEDKGRKWTNRDHEEKMAVYVSKKLKNLVGSVRRLSIT